MVSSIRASDRSEDPVFCLLDERSSGLVLRVSGDAGKRCYERFDTTRPTVPGAYPRHLFRTWHTFLSHGETSAGRPADSRRGVERSATRAGNVPRPTRSGRGMSADDWARGSPRFRRRQVRNRCGSSADHMWFADRPTEARCSAVPAACRGPLAGCSRVDGSGVTARISARGGSLRRARGTRATDRSRPCCGGVRRSRGSSAARARGCARPGGSR